MVAPANRPHDERDQKDQSLKDVRIMNDEGLTFGLPGTLFWGGVALTLVFAFILPIIFGVAFGLVYFMAMYGIHTNDPKALEAWVEAMGRNTVWSGGSHKGRQISYLLERE
ncbi:hypothetical protein EGT07_23715 [Herbaspirillum sp. HC18]|nr:hypothetical protein EGT07_23715 [Herbaspirillum sp. HC18]